ncbi:MAG: hypothetical protein J5845_06025 [Lachnospiraceae bacterium]|nr:hypothetical protein [Lachnospiraceae bacterium]
MLKCPKCSGMLIYDIATEGMRCSSCGRLYPDEELSGLKREAYIQRKVGNLMIEVDGNEGLIPAEDRGIPVTLYGCPACGRQMIADRGQTIIGCSFCGSRKELIPQDSAIHIPKRIIPFAVTEEECRKRYNSYIRTRIYRPFNVVQQEKNGGFRPIYMPFRSYDFEREGRFAFSGKTRERGEPGTIIVTRYLVHGKMRGRLTDISVPANEVMSNRVATRILPFKEDEAIPFDERFLQGYCACPETIDDRETVRIAKKLETEIVLAQAKESFHDIGLIPETARKQLLGQEKAGAEPKEEVRLYPVWAMPFKLGKRVSYAMVNGQTGEAAADVPVSRTKLFTYTAVTAIPLFMLFYLLLSTAMPSYLYFGTAVASLVIAKIFAAEVRDVYLKRVGYLLNSVVHQVADVLTYAVMAFGALLFLGYGAFVYNGALTDYYVLIPVTCVTAAVLTGYRFWEIYYRFTAITDFSFILPAAILTGTSVFSALFFLLNMDNSVIAYFVAAVLALGTAFAVMYMIEVHNMLETVGVKPVSAEGGGNA